MNHATDFAAHATATAAKPRTLAQITAIRRTLERHLGLGAAIAFAATALNHADASPKPPATDHDRALCAAVLVLEAGGEGVRGMRAVWEVVWNRSIQREMIPAAVVSQRWQFSCLNGVTHAVAIKRARLHPRWQDALAIIAAAPAGNLTGGADHYHAVTIRPPFWADKDKITCTIGGHRFYRLTSR